MQTTAIGTVANSLLQNEVIILTLLISTRYIPYTDLRKNFQHLATFSQILFHKPQMNTCFKCFSMLLVPRFANQPCHIALRCTGKSCIGYCLLFPQYGRQRLSLCLKVNYQQLANERRNVTCHVLLPRLKLADIPQTHII